MFEVITKKSVACAKMTVLLSSPELLCLFRNGIGGPGIALGKPFGG
jgi:hypothetical protein